MKEAPQYLSKEKGVLVEFQFLKACIHQIFKLQCPVLTLNNRIPSSVGLLKREEPKSTAVHSVCTQSFGKYNYSPSPRLWNCCTTAVKHATVIITDKRCMGPALLWQYANETLPLYPSCYWVILQFVETLWKSIDRTAERPSPFPPKGL